jgi:hypothetical protein
MKTSTIGAVLAAAGLAQAHYIFDVLTVNGQASRSWEYIRETTRREKYMPTKFLNSPEGLTPNDPDFRCNLGSFSNAGKTKTFEVAPGDDLSMVLAYGAKMEHPGPAQVYMSKAPGSVSTYEGDGDWFKILDETVCGSTADGLQDTDWCTWGKDRLSFTIPEQTPPGEYLIRAEHLGLHRAHVGETEFYYSCAQVKVTGNGSGKPSPVVQFPGAYKATDPGIDFSIWAGKREYPYHVGPDVWDGAAGSGGNSGNDTAPIEQPTAPTPSPGQFFPSSSGVLAISSTANSLPTTLATVTTTSAPVATSTDAELPAGDDDEEETETPDDIENFPSISDAPTSPTPTPGTPGPIGGTKPPKPGYQGPRRPTVMECYVKEE